MANEISLVTASGRTVTPKDDGIIYEVFSPGNGIIYGGAVTIKDSSTLHITAGHGIVCGRKFTIDDSDIPVALSGSGSLLGRLYIHLDLADAADPITLLVETGATLTPVVQDADVNINNGVYEINIATFDVDTSTISNLVNLDVTVAPMGNMEGATAGTDGKGGYVPAPQAGDEDKVLRGDGTWGSAGDTATVRYNENTGRFEVLLNGTWVQSIKAYADNLIFFDGTSFYEPYANGVYNADPSYTLDGGFTVNLPQFVAPLVTSNLHTRTFVFQDAYDVSDYSLLVVETSLGTKNIDLSNLSGQVYICMEVMQIGSSNDRRFYICLSSQKSDFRISANSYIRDYTDITDNVSIYSISLVK